MSLESDQSRIQYPGNNSAVSPYPVPFLFFNNEDLRVVVTSPDGVDTLLVLGTEFTATGAEDVNGGNVVTSDAWDNTYKITIYREVMATQEIVYEENADFPAKTQERGLDKLTMLCQQIFRNIRQSLRFRESDGELDPIPAVPNSLIGLDALKAPRAMTAAEVAVWLNLQQQFFGMGTKVFLDAADRGIAIPEYVGQMGVQVDDGSVWRSLSTDAGDWGSAVGAIADLSITLAKLANGILTATTEGRSKMADGYVTLAKLATSIFTADSDGRGKFASGFVNSALCASGLWNAIAPAGAVLQTVITEITANTSLTTLLPVDNTKPQSSEGTEVATATITPSSASNKILVEWSWMASNNADSTMGIAFFLDNSTDAFFASAASETANRSRAATNLAMHSPSSTSALVYKVRMGPATASTWRLNGSVSGLYFDGLSKCTLKLQEIKG